MLHYQHQTQSRTAYTGAEEGIRGFAMKMSMRREEEIRQYKSSGLSIGKCCMYVQFKDENGENFNFSFYLLFIAPCIR